MSKKTAGRLKDASTLSPKTINAMARQYEAMGFGFNPEGLANYKTDAAALDLAEAMGLPSETIAQRVIETITAADIEHRLPKCIQQFDTAAYVSMPLDDLRLAYGYLALVKAGARITPDQTKRAMQIAIKLDALDEPAEKIEHQLAAHDGKKRDTSKAASKSVAARRAKRNGAA